MPVSLALVLGFILGFYYVKIRITAIEEKSRAELETWKREAAGEIRKDSVNRSRSTLKGKIAEQMAPVLPDFCYVPSDARFIGSPVDYIIFDGLTRVADDKEDEIQIVFMDVKKGNGTLTRTQRLIRQAVEKKSVTWKTMRIPDD
ncbi:MAG: endonuclease [Methanoregulaceae archaeon]|nr:MAG: endonuclease [Methanoregulaceae archaeon]